jgi:hypothetical protein
VSESEKAKINEGGGKEVEKRRKKDEGKEEEKQEDREKERGAHGTVRVESLQNFAAGQGRSNEYSG